MTRLAKWNHPNGTVRIYCNGLEDWDDRKVWIEERPGKLIDFEVCSRGRFRTDEDAQIASDCLRGADLYLHNATFQDILSAAK